MAGFEPGDLVFCHSKGIIGRAIRVAQRLRNAPEDAMWNHVAVIDRRDEFGKYFVIQAEAKGVTNDKRLDSVTPGGRFKVVPFPATADREKFLTFVRSQVSDPYGYLTILSIALDFLLPRRIALRKSGTWVCSALAAGGLWYSGYPKAMTWPDLYQVTPADLYGALG